MKKSVYQTNLDKALMGEAFKMQTKQHLQDRNSAPNKKVKLARLVKLAKYYRMTQ